MSCPLPEELKIVTASGPLFTLGDPHANTTAELRALLWRLGREAGPGPHLEVGLRGGGTALARLDGIPGAILVSVDPYGHRPYPASDCRYGEDYEVSAMQLLAEAAAQYGFHWQHWRMTSLDFFRLVVPLGWWWGGERRDYSWATAFLDGEHVWATVQQEIAAVAPRLQPKGAIVIDNVNHAQPDGTDMRAKIHALARQLGLGCTSLLSGGDEIAVLSQLDIRGLLMG